MSLYDLAILIDDSASMEFDEKGERKEALKHVLHFLTRLYGAISDSTRGIKAIRFLNDDDAVEYDDLKNKSQIDTLIGEHKFEGLTRIGAGLMGKILKPFVFDEKPQVKNIARGMQKMKRPLLIMVITDGKVEGEPEGWVEIAVKSVVKALEARRPGSVDQKRPPVPGKGPGKGIVFQFARVGNDKEAEAFLKRLDDESDVKDHVDTMSGNDLMDVIGARKPDGYTPKDLETMIKLLLGPIHGTFDTLTKQRNIDDAADFDI